jgi:hypothetical protein
MTGITVVFIVKTKRKEINNELPADSLKGR